MFERSLRAVANRVSLPLIFVVIVGMVAFLLSEPVWMWINGDEEEDTVRFRQRLTFVLFWFVVLGMFQLKNSVQS